MTLHAFLIPEPSLRQMIEMCLTVGLKPDAFETQEASCDSETLARWVEEEWIEDDAAEELREIYRDGFRILRNDWKRTLPAEIAWDGWPGLDQVKMRRETTSDGHIEACVLDLQKSVRTEMMALLSAHAGEHQIQVALGESAIHLIDELCSGHSFYPHTKLNPLRRLGPVPANLAFTFSLPLETFAHSFYGLPELKKRAEGALRESASTADQETWLSLIEVAELMKIASNERLAWVGHLV